MMKKYSIVLIVVLLVAALLPGNVAAQSDDDAPEPCTGIVYAEGRARPPVVAGGNGAAFGVIYNPTDEDDTLLAARVSEAGAVEIHETMIDEDDVMQMMPLADGLTIPAGGAVVLRPREYHIMLIEVADELPEMLEITLEFENAGELVTEVPVRAVDGMAQPQDDASLAHNLMGDCPVVAVVDTFSRPTLVENSNGAVFGLILNLGEEELTLTGGQTPVAGAVEIHETRIDEDDVMQMMPLEDGLDILPGEAVRLRPGGYHIMLIGVSEPLEAGEMFDLALEFGERGLLDLEIEVVELMPPPMQGGMDGMGDSDSMDGMNDDAE